MTTYRIDFESLSWETVAPGLRAKIHEFDGKRLRIAEFSSEFMELDWCHRGHIGYVLEGQLQIDFNGRQVVFGPGDGVFIPAGEEHKHKAKVLSGVARLVLVDAGS